MMPQHPYRNIPRERTGIMLAYPYTEKRLLKYPKPWICQPKLNGDRCRALFTNEQGWQLFSSTARSLSFPHIQAELNMLFDGQRLQKLDGELYNHKLRHEEIRSRVAPTKNIHSDVASLQFHIFDVINDQPQALRLELLDPLRDGHFCKRVDTLSLHDVESLKAFHAECLDAGYEGSIIRDPTAIYKRKRSTQMMKWKPRDEMTAVVTELIEEKDVHTLKPKGSLGAVTCTLDGKQFFEVGSGFTHFERATFWQHPELIVGKLIEFAYSEISPYGVPKMTSFKRLKGHYE